MNYFSKFVGLSVLVALLVCLPSEGECKGKPFGGKHENSVFYYGFEGFSIGALQGFAASYLVARHTDSDDAVVFVTGTGIGALVGGALGIGIGVYDLRQRRPGTGYIVLRDMKWGSLFGGIAGAIGGTIAAVNDGEAEDVVLGTSIGVLAGGGLGLIFGFIEGPIIVNSRRHRADLGTVNVNMFAVRDSADQLVWLPGLSGTF